MILNGKCRHRVNFRKEPRKFIILKNWITYQSILITTRKIMSNRIIENPWSKHGLKCRDPKTSILLYQVDISIEYLDRWWAHATIQLHTKSTHHDLKIGGANGRGHGTLLKQEKEINLPRHIRLKVPHKLNNSKKSI